MGATSGDCAELVEPDSAIGHLLLASNGVKAPSVFISGNGKVQPFFPDPENLRSVRSVVDGGDLGRSLVEVLQVLHAWSGSPDLSSAAPSLPRMRSPKPGALVLAESTRSFTAVLWCRVCLLRIRCERGGGKDARRKNHADLYSPRPRSRHRLAARAANKGSKIVSARPVSRSASTYRWRSTAATSRTARQADLRIRAYVRPSLRGLSENWRLDGLARPSNEADRGPRIFLPTLCDDRTDDDGGQPTSGRFP